jgi:hypothetical protein
MKLIEPEIANEEHALIDKIPNPFAAKSDSGIPASAQAHKCPGSGN